MSKALVNILDYYNQTINILSIAAFTYYLLYLKKQKKHAKWKDLCCKSVFLIVYQLRYILKWIVILSQTVICCNAGPIYLHIMFLLSIRNMY